MKARRIDLTDYVAPGTDNNEKIQMKAALANLICHPMLKLAGKDLIIRGMQANSIQNCPDDYVDLDSGEYNEIKEAVEQIPLSRAFVPLVQRVLEAQEIEMEPKEAE